MYLYLQNIKSFFSIDFVKFYMWFIVIETSNTCYIWYINNLNSNLQITLKKIVVGTVHHIFLVLVEIQ